MPEQQGGLVTSFLSAFENLSAMERQKQQDKQAAVQQSVENAMRQHQQEIEERHYRAQEQQAATAEMLRATTEADRERHRLSLEERDKRRDLMRIQMADTAQKQRGSLKASEAAAGMYKWAKTQGWDDATAHELSANVVGEFYSQLGAQSPDTPGQAPAQPGQAPGQPGQPGQMPGQPPARRDVGIAPKVKASIDNIHSQIKARDEATTDMHTVHVAQAQKIASDTAYTQERTKLTHLQEEFIPKHYNLRVSEFQWKKMFEKGELDLRQFTAQTGRINSDLTARRNMLEAKKEADGMQRWATSYKAQTDKVLQAAKGKMRDAEAATSAASEWIAKYNKMDASEKTANAAGYMKMSAALALNSPKHLQDLQTDVDKATAARKTANQALYQANTIGKRIANPYGGSKAVPLLPTMPVDVRKGFTIPPGAKAAADRAANRSGKAQPRKRVRDMSTNELFKILGR